MSDRPGTLRAAGGRPAGDSPGRAVRLSSRPGRAAGPGPGPAGPGRTPDRDRGSEPRRLGPYPCPAGPTEPARRRAPGRRGEAAVRYRVTGVRYGDRVTIGTVDRTVPYGTTVQYSDRTVPGSTRGGGPRPGTDSSKFTCGRGGRAGCRLRRGLDLTPLSLAVRSVSTGAARRPFWCGLRHRARVRTRFGGQDCRFTRSAIQEELPFFLPPELCTSLGSVDCKGQIPPPALVAGAVLLPLAMYTTRDPAQGAQTQVKEIAERGERGRQGGWGARGERECGWESERDIEGCAPFLSSMGPMLLTMASEAVLAGGSCLKTTRKR
eukprot:765093-Hanusia_phi.AAC.1